MGDALVLVPVIGSALWVTLATLAQRSDLDRQRTEALEGRRVLPRPWSIVSDNPQYAGHWFFLTASIIYASVVPTCSLWQEAAMGHSDRPLVICAIVSAIAFFLMALVPHADGGIASSIWHNLMAGAFLGAGSSWALRSMFVLQEVQGMGAALGIRIFATAVAWLSILVMIFGALPLYFDAAKKFDAVYHPRTGESQLEPLPAEKEWGLRKRMAVLFVTQASWGASLAVVTATCAAEVIEIKDTDGYSAGVIISGSVLLSTAAVSLLAYFICQPAHPDVILRKGLPS